MVFRRRFRREDAEQVGNLVGFWARDYPFWRVPGSGSRFYRTYSRRGVGSLVFFCVLVLPSWVVRNGGFRA